MSADSLLLLKKMKLLLYLWLNNAASLQLTNKSKLPQWGR